MERYEYYATRLSRMVGSTEGPVSPPVVGSASFGYGDCETGEAIFSGEVKKPLYARMGNPTTAKLESLLAYIDGGAGAVAGPSGMAATTLAVLSLCNAGDRIVSVGGLFGGTYTLFNETLPRYGMTVDFLEVDDWEGLEAKLDGAKMLFCESVGNPNMKLPDLKRLGERAAVHKAAFVVDNTITPIAVRPLELGADMAVYSTTKIIAGNASALGGAVVFKELAENDKLLDGQFPMLWPFFQKVGKMAMVMNAKKRVQRDFGFSANAFASYLTLLGLETLPLRLERISRNMEVLVRKLEQGGVAVRHPALASHEHHDRYKADFDHGCGTLFTVDFGTKEKAFRALNAMEGVVKTANIGDSRTLGLHMASTIYREASPEERKLLGITDGLVRFSLGLENPETVAEEILSSVG